MRIDFSRNQPTNVQPLLNHAENKPLLTGMAFLMTLTSHSISSPLAVSEFRDWWNLFKNRLQISSQCSKDVERTWGVQLVFDLSATLRFLVPVFEGVVHLPSKDQWTLTCTILEFCMEIISFLALWHTVLNILVFCVLQSEARTRS